MSPPRPAHARVGRMPPMIIVRDQHAERGLGQQQVHRERDEQRSRRTDRDDLRRADAVGEHPEQRDRHELQQAADQRREGEVVVLEAEHTDAVADRVGVHERVRADAEQRRADRDDDGDRVLAEHCEHRQPLALVIGHDLLEDRRLVDRETQVERDGEQRERQRGTARAIPTPAWLPARASRT